MSHWDHFVTNVNTLLRSGIFSYDSVNLLQIFNIQKGVCFGLTGMWMQAVFCNGEDKFNKRMQILCRDSRQGWIVRKQKYVNLVEPIVMLRNEYHASGSVKLREYSIYLEIPAFLEGILLYQKPAPTSFYDFVGEFQNITRISPYVMSHKLAIKNQSEELKPIRQVWRFCMAGNQVEYGQLLTTLCKNMSVQVQEFVVLFSAKKHVIGFSYKNNEFAVFDQNFLDNGNNTGVIVTPDIAAAVVLIFSAFKENASLICFIRTCVAPQMHDISFPEMRFQVSSRYFPTFNHINYDQIRLFHVAIEHNDYILIESLVKCSAAIVNSSDVSGLTALCRASKRGYYKIVSLLLKSGANPELATPGGTPLQIAQSHGHQQIVELLQIEIESRKRKSPLYSYEVLADSPIKKRRILPPQSYSDS